MKLKTLLVSTVALLCSVGAWAGILDGWTKMETNVIANPQNYYFIILHTDNSLMLGTTKTCSSRADGTTDTNSETYDFVSYQTASEPAQDLCKVWTIESCTNGSYSSAYIMRSLANVDCPTNTGSYQWELKTDGAVHENSAESAAFNVVLSDGFWKLQDATATTFYWGPWSNGAYVNNERVAGNAGGNGQASGSFNIYYMSRTTFNQKYQFFGGTDMNHTIVNRDFEYGSATGWSPDETESATLTIKNSATGSHVSAAKSGSYYCYMKRDGGWAAAKQTINNLPSGKYSSTIYLCNDINFLFNNTSAESWSTKTPSGSWTAITVSDEDITSGSTELRIRGWGDNRFADNASLTYVPNTVSDDPSAYTLETTTTPLTWYSVTIANAGLYILTSSEATTLRYTTSSTAKPEDATDITLSAGEKYFITLPAGTFYFGTSSATQVNLSTDFTYYITNPSFETGYKLDPVTGWIVTVTSGSSTNANCRYKGDDQDSEGKKTGTGFVLGYGEDGGNIRFSLWTANAGAGSVKQTLTSLPAGNYKLSAYMATGANSTLTLSAGSTYRTIRAANSDPNLVELYFTQASTGNVEIKATCNASWFDADNFKLESVGELPAELTGVSGDMNATVASTQSSAITTYSGSKTFANLLAAQTAINAALASKLVYEEISGIQSTYATRVESLDSDGQTAYTTAINTTSTGAAWKYTNGSYSTAAEAETAFHDDYVTAVKAQMTNNTDMTEAIVNPSFETNSFTGWTNSGMKIGTSGLDGMSGSYFADQWHNAGDKSIKQSITGLHQGKYRLTALATANASTTSPQLYVKLGESDPITTVVSAASDYNVDFNYDGSSTLEIGFSATLSGEGWAAVDNFRLTYLETYYALDADYTALSAAITSAEGRTLGFEDGEYAPYNNTEILAKLDEARDLVAESPRTNHLRSDFLTLIADLESDGSWSANDGRVNAIYNWDMAIADGSNPKGWSRQDNNWGQQATPSEGFDFSSTSNNTAWYYNNWSSAQSSYYGNVGHYTMPLKANTIYQLKVKYCSQGTDSYGLVSSYKATVQKEEESAVLDEFEFGGNATRTFVEKSVYFVTSDAGNYKLTLTNVGNIYFTDVSLKKVDALTLDQTSAVNYVAGTYPAVTLSRSLLTDDWNTLCLPFATSVSDYAAVRELTDVDVDGDHVSITFSDVVGTLTAGKPYLVKGKGGSSISATNVAVQTEPDTAPSVTEAGVTVTYNGIFAPLATVPANDGNYIVSSSKLHLVDSDVSLKGYRGYFNVAVPDPASVKSIVLNFDDATIIKALEAAENEKTVICNLAGQRLSKAQKGVNIINGKKVLVK